MHLNSGATFNVICQLRVITSRCSSEVPAASPSPSGEVGTSAGHYYRLGHLCWCRNGSCSPKYGSGGPWASPSTSSYINAFVLPDWWCQENENVEMASVQVPAASKYVKVNTATKNHVPSPDKSRIWNWSWMDLDLAPLLLLTNPNSFFDVKSISVQQRVDNAFWCHPLTRFQVSPAAFSKFRRSEVAMKDFPITPILTSFVWADPGQKWKWSIPELKYHKHVPIFNVCVKFSLQISTRIFSESPFNVKYFAHSKVPSKWLNCAAIGLEMYPLGKGRITQKTSDAFTGDKVPYTENNRPYAIDRRKWHLFQQVNFSQILE